MIAYVTLFSNVSIIIQSQHNFCTSFFNGDKPKILTEFFFLFKVGRRVHHVCNSSGKTVVRSNWDKAGNRTGIQATNAAETPMTTILPLTRGRRGASCEQALCQVTAFRFWTPSPGVENWTLVSPELFLRRLPVLLRMELLRRIELRFLNEFWWDSSLFCRVWIRMEGFSSSSRALHTGVFTFKKEKGARLKPLVLIILQSQRLTRRGSVGPFGFLFILLS